MLPSEISNVAIDTQAQMSLITVIILVGTSIKSMELVRFNPKMGQLVKLVVAVLFDVKDLFLFMCFWIFMFSLLYYTMGYQIANDRLVDQETLWDYVITSWKVATKGSAHKSVISFWDADEDYEFMQHIIMMMQIINEIYIKIIMLSFLIALVNKSF